MSRALAGRATQGAPARRFDPAVPIVLFAGVLCGTTGTALEWLAPEATALSAGAMRLLIGGICLVLLAAWQGHRMGHLAGHWPWLVVGAIAVASYQLCFFTGTTRTGIALGTVVALGSAPIFTGMINGIGMRRPPTIAWLVGTALAIGGIALITQGQPTARTDLLGVIAALGAGLGWAVYAMIGQHRISAGLDSTTCMAAMFLGGGLLSTPLLFAEDVGWILTPRGGMLSLYLGIVTVGVVYTCLGWGIKRIGAPTVVTLTLAEPVTAAVLATVLMHQYLGVVGWLGVVIVLVALLITARGAEQPDAEPVTDHIAPHKPA